MYMFKSLHIVFTFICSMLYFYFLLSLFFPSSLSIFLAQAHKRLSRGAIPASPLLHALWGSSDDPGAPVAPIPGLGFLPQQGGSKSSSSTSASSTRRAASARSPALRDDDHDEQQALPLRRRKAKALDLPPSEQQGEGGEASIPLLGGGGVSTTSRAAAAAAAAARSPPRNPPAVAASPSPTRRPRPQEQQQQPHLSPKAAAAAQARAQAAARKPSLAAANGTTTTAAVGASSSSTTSVFGSSAKGVRRSPRAHDSSTPAANDHQASPWRYAQYQEMSVTSPAADLAAEAGDHDDDVAAGTSSSSSWFQPLRPQRSSAVSTARDVAAKSTPSNKASTAGGNGSSSSSGGGGGGASLSFGAREWLARFSPLPPTPPQRLTARALAAAQQDQHRSPSLASSSPPPPRSQPTRRNGASGANSSSTAQYKDEGEAEEEEAEGGVLVQLPPLVNMTEVEVADWLRSDSRLQLLAPSLEGVDGATLAEATFAELQVMIVQHKMLPTVCCAMKMRNTCCVQPQFNAARIAPLSPLHEFLRCVFSFRLCGAGAGCARVAMQNFGACVAGDFCRRSRCQREQQQCVDTSTFASTCTNKHQQTRRRREQRQRQEAQRGYIRSWCVTCKTRDQKPQVAAAKNS